MTTISIKEARLANNDRTTLGRLMNLGVTSRHQKYELTAAQMNGCGLAPNALLPLLKAPVAAVLDGQGAELEPATMVALSIAVHHTGIAEVTLGVDLAE